MDYMFVQEILNHGKILGTCFAGSAISYLYGSQTGGEVAKEKLQSLIPNMRSVDYERASAILTVTVGTFGGMMVYSPDGVFHAFAAGAAGPAAIKSFFIDNKKAPEDRTGG